MRYKPDLMIYHAHCADGFGAAWAAWTLWGDTVEYVAASYGQSPPDVLGKHVLIGDFSYKRDGIDAMMQGAASVVILDHHKTAEAELAPFAVETGGAGALGTDMVPAILRDLADLSRPPCIASFDMKRSGAVMTWQFCHPGAEVPMLLRLIEDRDLWRFQYSQTKPFGVWLRCEQFDFVRWTEIAEGLADIDKQELIFAEATAMQRFFDKKVIEIAQLSRPGRVAGFDVPVCNCPPMFASEVGHHLLNTNPDAPFAAMYSDQGNARGWSLRSDDHRQDVSAIARRFGGGGHRNAAGFGSPLI